MTQDMNTEIEIPEGYEARIEGNKVIIGLKESKDERIRKEIIKYLTVTREKDLVGHPERQRWIAYLERQKEQNAEWSEEDKKMIDKCIELVFFAMPANMSAIKTKEQCIIWLKSLRPRPHWKPSK